MKFYAFEKYEFCEWDISQKAFEVYSNSDFVFYKIFYNHKDVYFASDNQNGNTYYIGTLKDVEDFLLQFAD